MRRHVSVEFSHSICPPCFKKHYGEFMDTAGDGNPASDGSTGGSDGAS